MSRFILFVIILATIFLSGCASQLAATSSVSLAKPDTTTDIKEHRAIIIGTWFG